MDTSGWYERKTCESIPEKEAWSIQYSPGDPWSSRLSIPPEFTWFVLSNHLCRQSQIQWIFCQGSVSWWISTSLQPWLQALVGHKSLAATRGEARKVVDKTEKVLCSTSHFSHFHSFGEFHVYYLLIYWPLAAHPPGTTTTSICSHFRVKAFNAFFRPLCRKLNEGLCSLDFQPGFQVEINEELVRVVLWAASQTPSLSRQWFLGKFPGQASFSGTRETWNDPWWFCSRA